MQISLLLAKPNLQPDWTVRHLTNLDCSSMSTRCLVCRDRRVHHGPGCLENKELKELSELSPLPLQAPQPHEHASRRLQPRAGQLENSQETPAPVFTGCSHPAYVGSNFYCSVNKACLEEPNRLAPQISSCAGSFLCRGQGVSWDYHRFFSGLLVSEGPLPKCQKVRQ